MTAVLQFRSVDLQANGLKFHLTKGFLTPAAVRGEDYIVAAKDGRSSGNRVADTRSLLLEGYVQASTPAAWKTARDALLAILDEGGASPGTLRLDGTYYGIPSGHHYTITARVTNVIEGVVFAFTYQPFSIELESVDADWTYT